MFKNDYLTFYHKEMQFRKLGKYPPYYYLINFTIAHKNMKKVMEAAKHVHQILLQHLSEKHSYLDLLQRQLLELITNIVFKYWLNTSESQN